MIEQSEDQTTVSNYNHIKIRVDRLETDIVRLDEIVEALQTDIITIKSIMPTLATKLDLAHMNSSMSSKIDSCVNGLLRDALSAIPGKQALIWSTVSALIALIGLALTLRTLMWRGN